MWKLSDSGACVDVLARLADRVTAAKAAASEAMAARVLPDHLTDEQGAAATAAEAAAIDGAAALVAATFALGPADFPVSYHASGMADPRGGSRSAVRIGL